MSRVRVGGGGGRRGPPGTHRIAGVDVPVDSTLLVSERPQPSPLFPNADITKPAPLTREERMQIAKFRLFRDRIHEGPLYTVLGDDARVGKHQSWAAASSDPFEGMPTYSQKYARKRRRVPKLDTRPYVSTFFPKELWSILDPTRATANGVEATPKTKKLQISTSNKTTGLSAYDREMTNEPEATKSTADRGANGDVEDDEADDRDGDEEAPPEEEEMDDDYDDDEDDMGGDYNAEQYFDDGGDQMGDDYDGGDSGEGEY